MKRRTVLRAITMFSGASGLSRFDIAQYPHPDTAKETASAQRSYWVKMLERVSHPVLSSLAAGQLRRRMPVECAPGLTVDRSRVTYLEAAARTLAGIAPWIENGPTGGVEGRLRRQYTEWALSAITNGVNQQSEDYLNFGIDRQTIVDAAFLSLAICRAPKQLRDALQVQTKAALAAALRATRRLMAPFNNWLLFSAMIEVCLLQLGESFDRMRIDYALREHASWYLGDGTYGDGPSFHADYYNSFVIHPFLLAIIDGVGAMTPEWEAMRQPILKRAQRYAAIQERTISPDGTYPILGRSVSYRCGAFHLLSDVALRGFLPEEITGAQVRCALTAVIRKTLDADGTFDAEGWLTIGLSGHQPALGERYISTGSLYLCSAAFLALGLPPESAFWTVSSTPWTSQRAWGGENVSTDHAL